MRTPQSALDLYVRRYAFVREKIERLQQLADDHFGHDPDAVHWGHVGDLGRVEQALDELLDIFDGNVE
jgi:hypothetical protein